MSGIPTPSISPEMINNLSFLDNRDASFWTFGGSGTGFDDFPSDALFDASTALHSSTSNCNLFDPCNDPILSSHDFDKNPLGLFGHTDLSAGNLDYFSLPLTPSSSSPATSSSDNHSSKCSCLSHHAKLLCRLKTLWQASAPPPIDVVLDGVKQVLEPWKQFIQCHICQPDEDQEALLLSAMSFRVVLRLLQRVCNRSSSTANLSSSNDFDNSFFEDMKLQQQWNIPSHQNMGLRVGNYDITGDEQNLVLDLLVSQTLGKIQFAIECLKERSVLQRSNSSEMMMEREGIPDQDYVQQLLGNLESTVQVLHRGLQVKGNVNSGMMDQKMGEGMCV